MLRCQEAVVLTMLVSHTIIHDAFMTLSPYTSAREDEVRQLGSGPKPCRVDL
jgi:hypothetical protein